MKFMTFKPAPTLWPFGIAALFIVAGCAPRQSAHPLRDNVYAASPRLPTSIRRVAVLPFSTELADWQAQNGRMELEPVLLRELGKLNRFELTLVTPQQLQLWTGRASWLPGEALPQGLLDRLRKDLACDAALFTHLQHYQAYRPIVLGWNMKLLDLQQQQFIWTVDEVFDGGDKFVLHEAHRYHSHHRERGCVCRPSELVLLSPREFGSFSLSALLATLPSR